MHFEDIIPGQGKRGGYKKMPKGSRMQIYLKPETRAELLFLASRWDTSVSEAIRISARFAADAERKMIQEEKQ